MTLRDEAIARPAVLGTHPFLSSLVYLLPHKLALPSTNVLLAAVCRCLPFFTTRPSMSAKIDKIEKSLPFGTIGNRQTLSGSALGPRRCAGDCDTSSRY